MRCPSRFYDPPTDVVEAFGPAGVAGYEAAPAHHGTNTLMHDYWHANHANVTNVVGRLILHDKAHVWQRKHAHYHHGLVAGENTLNAHLLRVLLRKVGDQHGYFSGEWLLAYATFMTTKGSHNDSYADSSHVQFFGKMTTGLPLERW